MKQTLAVCLAIIVSTPRLSLAQESDGGYPHQAGQIDKASVWPLDGGERFVVKDGVWLSPSYAVGFSQELADKRARVESMEADLKASLPIRWILISSGIALACGVAVGTTVGVVAGRASK